MSHSIAGLILLAGCASVCAASDGLWDVKSLRQAPKFTEIERKGNLCTLYYDGEPYRGKPTRVLAYLAYPEAASDEAGSGIPPHPAIVLVHGGAGRAFPEWAQTWASRGYVALAMDHFGQGPDGKRMDDGGPNLDGDTIFPADAKDGWAYAAVAKVIRGVSLLRSLPEVDPKRIGITGVSWGGYLTCIVAGLDERVRAAAPIYGCGYLHESSTWSAGIQALPAERRSVWIESLDPSCYLGQAKAPMLFINGSADPCFWLDSYQKSYRLVRNRTVCIKVNKVHNQDEGANPVEIGVFMDQHLNAGKALPTLGQPKRRGNIIEARFKSPAAVSKAELCFTTDTGAWTERKWQTREASIDGQTIRAELPAERPLVYFISLTDARDASVTTEHETLTE